MVQWVSSRVRFRDGIPKQEYVNRADDGRNRGHPWPKLLFMLGCRTYDLQGSGFRV